MSDKGSTLGIIGRAERVNFIDFGMNGVPAKIDTGADSSSIWASDIAYDEAAGFLSFRLFGPGSDFYGGEPVILPRDEFCLTRVSSSTGHKQIRYTVKLRVSVRGRIIRGTFTLADRSQRTYPVLLGRRLLHKKFLVDVSKGDPLSDIEDAKRENMRLVLKDMLN